VIIEWRQDPPTDDEVCSGLAARRRGSPTTPIAAASTPTRLASVSLVCSMSRAGACLDNAMAESFCATRKAELVERHQWATRAAARTALFAWIAVCYNRQRRHSALAY
jgi:putative transposase